MLFFDIIAGFVIAGCHCVLYVVYWPSVVKMAGYAPSRPIHIQKKERRQYLAIFTENYFWNFLCVALCSKNNLPNSPAHQSLFAVVRHVLGSSEQIKQAGVTTGGSLSQLSHTHTAEATDIRLFPAAEFLVSGMAFTVWVAECTCWR